MNKSISSCLVISRWKKWHKFHAGSVCLLSIFKILYYNLNHKKESGEFDSKIEVIVINYKRNQCLPPLSGLAHKSKRSKNKIFFFLIDVYYEYSSSMRDVIFKPVNRKVRTSSACYGEFFNVRNFVNFLNFPSIFQLIFA